MTVISETSAMIAGMDPVLDPEIWVFCTLPEGNLSARARPAALASFAEEEGLTLILPQAAARELDLPVHHPMQRITLQVYSSLEGVGLTAAVAGALAQAGIPCNMVAAFHHDHAFVPAAQARTALDILLALSQRPQGH